MTVSIIKLMEYTYTYVLYREICICQILHIPIFAMQSTNRPTNSFSQLETERCSPHTHIIYFEQINCSYLYRLHVCGWNCEHEHEHKHSKFNYIYNTKTNEKQQNTNNFHNAKQHERHFIARKMFVNLFLELS